MQGRAPVLVAVKFEGAQVQGFSDLFLGDVRAAAEDDQGGVLLRLGLDWGGGWVGGWVGGWIEWMNRLVEWVMSRLVKRSV